MPRFSHVALAVTLCLAASAHAVDYKQLSAAKRLVADKRYDEAIQKSDPSTSSRSAWVARFNLAVCLVALGRPEEAQSRIAELQELAVMLGNGLDLLRVRWPEAQIQAGFGEREEAILALGSVRDGFLARGILNDAALAGLERAGLQLQEGRTAEVKVEAPELAECFQNLGVAPELLASLTLFCGAAQAQVATAEEAHQILSLLRQAFGVPSQAP
jgi:hypothetical protein